MAVRTNDTKVKKVLRLGSTGGDYDDENNPDLLPYIEAASGLVDALEAAMEEIILSSGELERVETWLAAHFYASSDQPLESEATDGARATYQGKTGFYLDGTKYGQQAMLLDRTGFLRDLSEGKGVEEVVGGIWLGRERNRPF